MRVSEQMNPFDDVEKPPDLPLGSGCPRKRRPIVLLLAVVLVCAFILGLWPWLKTQPWVPAKTPSEIVEAAVRESVAQSTASGWPKYGPRIIAFSSEHPTWLFKVIRDGPDGEEIIATGRMNYRTLDVLSEEAQGQGAEIVPPEGYPVTRHIPHVPEPPLTPDEADRLRKNLERNGWSEKDIFYEVSMIVEEGFYRYPTQAKPLWKHAVTKGYLGEEEKTVVVFVDSMGFEDSREGYWLFYADYALAGGPSGHGGGPCMARLINVRTLETQVGF